MIDKTLGRLTGTEIAVDLGTANTRLFVRGRGVAVEAPTVVAVERSQRGNAVVATGDEAKRMLGRTPEHITAVRPIREGVVSDYALVEELLRDCIAHVSSGRRTPRSRMVVTVPQATSDVERRAVQDSARAVGAREVTLVSKGVAAALGAGLPIHDARGTVVVDIGAGVTEVAVLSLGGLVDATSIRVAGDALDAAITAWVKERHNVLLGARAAESVKLAVGCAMPRQEAAIARFTGRDLGSGIPREVALSSDDLIQPLRTALQPVVEAIRQVMARTTPEIASDVADLGLLLTGGSALLPGLDGWLTDQTGLTVAVAEDPTRCSCIGAGLLLAEPDSRDRLAL